MITIPVYLCLYHGKIIFPDVTGFRYSDCECPDACLVKAYGAELSYAALSPLSVDNLLRANISDLSFKYHRALEMQQVIHHMLSQHQIAFFGPNLVLIKAKHVYKITRKFLATFTPFTSHVTSCKSCNTQFIYISVVHSGFKEPFA